MNNDQRLTNAFSTAGKECGYDSVTAEFTETKEFKVKWRRSCGWAEFKVSDYLKDAPESVLLGLAKLIFSRISGMKIKYPKEMQDWITSETFVKKAQPLYMARSRNMTRTTAGEHKDLNESYQRLIDSGLVERDESLKITWTKRPNTRRIGFCSVLCKVICITSAIDNPDVPDFVVDYILYHELCHLKKRFDPFGESHDIAFRLLEDKFEKKADAEKILAKLRLIL
ncbi:MAG: hypothetical protein FWD92_06235 [Methanomassiliicoccaceae archaeon]|nr:hypothetical protein [Methanomassiliicoccaceae archaeon]